MPTTEPGDQPASYRHLLERRKLYWENRRRAPGEAVFAEMKMLDRINNKIRGTEWARGQGVRTVDYTVFPDPETALAETALSRFVLKPVGGHSSQGVYLLSRDGNGGYDCAMTARHFADDDALVAEYEGLRERQIDKMTRRVLVESLVEDSFGFDVALDYKIYAFATGIPLIMQRYGPSHSKQGGWAFEFYDGEGKRLGPVRLKTPGNPDNMLTPPPGLPAIVEAANRLVQAAGVSFIRVDMYLAADGPVFGEFTPVPNNAKERFEPETDAMLGRHWADSLRKLGLDYTAPLGKRRPPITFDT